MTKIFLADIDGVVLNFHKTFEHWVRAQGYETVTENIATKDHFYRVEEWLNVTSAEAEDIIGAFFETDYSEHFVPYKDAVEVIPYLKDQGWNFVAVTAIGDSEIARKHRHKALNKIFGEYTFSDVITVHPFGSKFAELAKFDPTLWVDDTPHHVRTGIEAGHTSFRLHRDGDVRHNLDMEGFNVVRDWYEIKDWIYGSNG